MGMAGRPTDLTKELLINIKQDILDGKNLKEIAQHREIPEITIYTWHSKNYIGLADKIENWKRDRKLMLAERNIEEMLEMSDTNLKEVGEQIKVFKDPQLTRIKADLSKFVAETLGRNNYSKRTETDITSDGEPIKGFNFILNADDKTNNQTGEGLEQTERQDN